MLKKIRSVWSQKYRIKSLLKLKSNYSKFLRDHLPIFLVYFCRNEWFWGKHNFWIRRHWTCFDAYFWIRYFINIHANQIFWLMIHILSNYFVIICKESTKPYFYVNDFGFSKLLWINLRLKQIFQVQWKPLNVITLGQRETDNTIRMITITEWTPYIYNFQLCRLAFAKLIT